MYTDLLILFLVLCLAVSGYFRGFLDQFISILSLLAIILFANNLVLIAREQIEIQMVQEAPQFVLFILAAVLIMAIGIGLKLILHYKKSRILIPFDRSFGFVLGGVKAVVFLIVVLTAYQALPTDIRGRFSEMERDMADSTMVSASQTVFSWDSIALIQQLQNIRQALEQKTQELQDGTPWDWGYGVDSDSSDN